ncbi:MAG: hypothetical protein LBM25_05320 [Bacteroidales bacterium]|nr:hypothetical protein [Bacteroidales bacterium]
MNFKRFFRHIFAVIFFVPTLVLAQENLDKASPDFQYEDYSSFIGFMMKDADLTNQTLYLPKMTDTIAKHFFSGELYRQEYNGPNGNRPALYDLKRMSKNKLPQMEGEWFVVAGYAIDKQSYEKIYYNSPMVKYSFLKLVVAQTEDTVFYKYDDFWNLYNFPFIPLSYYNANKNEYPKNKYSEDDLSLAKYDTNSNYCFIPKNLIGQRLYLPKVNDATYERLFSATRLYNYDDDSRKYSFAIMPQGKAKLLEGKTFYVASTVFDPEGLTDVYLKLIIPNSKDTIYYKYPRVEQRAEFPFVVNSFLEKTKEKYINKEFVFRGDKYPLVALDTKRKTPLTFKKGDVFRCIDFVVKDGKFQMLMRNEKGRKFFVEANYALSDKLSFDHSLMEYNDIYIYHDTYNTHYNAILQKELIPSMSIDMTKKSWGYPQKEVFTNFDGSNRHWFYLGNVYVIFKNNKLYRVAMIPRDLRL